MARNRILKNATIADIDDRVERVLRGLGNPKPPLDLAQVRELLKLDRDFYAADDPSALQETISRLRVAGIQIFKRPSLLLEAIKSFSLQALYIPDQRRILLDKSIPPIKHRWSEAHEIGHSLLPWHGEIMLGDNKQTLSQNCHEQVEAEANFAAGRMLFLRDAFSEQVADEKLSISAVQGLSKEFGNTLSSTLWRYVETAGAVVPMLGMITCHPHPSRFPGLGTPPDFCRYYIRSPEYFKRFSALTEAELFEKIGQYCNAKGGGPLGQSEVVLIDDNGKRHVFIFETFFNKYDALTLGVYCRPEGSMIAVP